MNQAVYGKYILSKANGKPLDPSATYFVLRLDTDEAARAAIRAYAEVTQDEGLAGKLMACVDELEAPGCGCREAHCPHTKIFSDVWTVGENEQ